MYVGVITDDRLLQLLLEHRKDVQKGAATYSLAPEIVSRFLKRPFFIPTSSLL